MISCDQANKALDELRNYLIAYPGEAHCVLAEFIKSVDHLLKHNSIKQVPALFKEIK